MHWRGRYVETPCGRWGICCKETVDELEVLLDSDSSTASDAQCATSTVALRPEEVRRSSWCALGTCVLSSFGPGVVLRYRVEDDMHEVQLWGPLSQGQNRAFLRREALQEVLPALPGLAVETSSGSGICQTVEPERISVKLTEAGEVVWMSAKDVQCPVAKTLPLVNRFLDVAATMVKFHSGMLLRLADAFQGLGLERLQDLLLSRASEAAGTALQLWDDFEAKEAKELAESLKSQADAAMPKLQGLVSSLFSGLNQLISRALFDGVWIGKDDLEARCTIKDAMLQWHWGEESDFSIQCMWSETSISTLLAGEIFKGSLRLDGCLQWSDGDVWQRRDGEEETEEIAMDLRSLHFRLVTFREMVASGDFSGLEVDGLEDAVRCLSKIAQTASADEDVKVLASNLQEQMERCQEQLQWVLELGSSKAGAVLLQGQKRLAEQLTQLQETAITPQLDAVQKRSQRFLTHLATDDKVKSKASQLFSAVEQRFAEQLPNQLEEWVQNLRSQVRDQLGLNRALLVDGLKALPVNQEALREILLASWDHTAKLEAQLESCILDALNASGVDCTGTELLNCFESSTAFSNIPALRQSSGSLLTLLKDLNIEVPSAVQNLLEAHAAGRSQDANAWKAALKSSLDDEVMVKGATGIVEHGERVMAKLQELKENQAVARVVEQLEKNEDMDIEREVMNRIHDFNPEQALSKAEEAWSNIEAREELVNHLKDTCLDFILKILPAIQIEKVNGQDNDCDWEISNINFSDFSFRKEDVRVTLNDLNASEEVLRISAWNISAHFYGLKVYVCPTSLIAAECTGDAIAEGMSLDLAFRWQRPPADSPDGTLPQLVMCSRKIEMASLDLWVHQTDWSVSTIVNALTFLFADVLKRYACEKIASKLDEHMGVLVEGLNSSLVSCAPLLKRLGFSDLLDLGQEEPSQEPSIAIDPKIQDARQTGFWRQDSWFNSMRQDPNDLYRNPLDCLG